MKRVTIRDVAREAGVSPSTVSRALKGHTLISEETKEAVRRACIRLRYVPDLTAQSLAGRQTRSIGVILPDIRNPFYAALFTVIEESAAENGYSVLLINTRYDPDRELDAVDRMLAQQVDGVLLASVSPEAQRRYTSLFSSTPIVCIGNNHVGDCSFVEADNTQGAWEAVRYLRHLGHQRVAFFGGGRASRTLELRLNGYHSAMAQGGEPIVCALAPHSSDLRAWYRQQALDLFQQKDPPTAVLAYSDEIAMELLDVLAELEMEVPRDLSLIGFDNADFASLPYISLTTVSQKKYRMGRLATQRLLEKIGGDQRQTSDILQPELMIRSSCRRI